MPDRGFDRAYFAARIAGFATEHGAATCGCLPLLRWEELMLPHRLRPAYPGWPLCPTCGGTGVDPRVTG